MADIKINNTEYNDVPRLDVPTQSGGVASFYEVSGDLSITENGSYDVTSTESVTVDVAGSGGLTWDDVVRGDTETITISEAKDMGTYKVIPDHRFRNYDMKKVSITDENDYQIGAYAFADCSNLKEIDMPNCTKLGQYCFRGSNIDSFTVPAKSKDSADYALSGINSSYINTGSLKGLPYSFCARCNILVTLEAPNATYFDGYVAYYNTKLKYVVAPKLKSIGQDCFYNCSSLVSADFPSLEATSYESFYGCTSLKEIEFNSLKSCGQMCFWGCASLEKITASCTSIISGGMANCSHLAIIDLTGQAGGCSGGGGLFEKNPSLKTLILRNTSSVWQVGGYPCSDTLIASGSGYIYVPSALVDSYKTATNWVTYADQFRSLEDYTVDGTVTGALDETKI